MEVVVSRWGERSKEQNELSKGLVQFGGLVKAIPRNNQGEFGAFSDLDAVLDVIEQPMCKAGLGIMSHDLGETICLETTIARHRAVQNRVQVPVHKQSRMLRSRRSVGYWSRICLMKALGLRSESLGKTAADDDDGKKGRGVFDAGLSRQREKWFSKAEGSVCPGADRADVLTKIHDSVAKEDDWGNDGRPPQTIPSERR